MACIGRSLEGRFAVPRLKALLTMAESTSSSEKLRREAEELRQTAQRLIEEAARLLAKSTELEKQISAHENRPK
jgi:hypothetical protein